MDTKTILNELKTCASEIRAQVSATQSLLTTVENRIRLGWKTHNGRNIFEFRNALESEISGLKRELNIIMFNIEEIETVHAIDVFEKLLVISESKQVCIIRGEGQTLITVWKKNSRFWVLFTSGVREFSRDITKDVARQIVEKFYKVGKVYTIEEMKKIYSFGMDIEKTSQTKI